MIKGILFDWHGVLVENDSCDEDRRKELYSKLLQLCRKMIVKRL